MFTSTITSKGQVTIPKKLRDSLSLRTNDKVIFVRRDDSLILKPVKGILDLRGSVQSDSTQGYKKIRENVKKRVTRGIATR